VSVDGIEVRQGEGSLRKVRQKVGLVFSYPEQAALRGDCLQGGILRPQELGDPRRYFEGQGRRGAWAGGDRQRPL
jgi:hypothetical protein